MWSLSAAGVIASIVLPGFAAGGDAEPVGLVTIPPPPFNASGYGTPDLTDYLYLQAGLPDSVAGTAPAELEALDSGDPPPPAANLPEPVTEHWPSYEKWARLRRCESGDDPGAVSEDGTYRGLYQFDLQTWHSIGGVGDPVDASREEQDLRALLLYAARGARPWPVCGRYLL